MNFLRSFSDAAGKLSRNPLGIIALFIVLVYGMASLVTASIGSSGSSELNYLIYFLIFFPVLVLAAFLWLVSQHSDKLYGPGDFTNEDNFMALRIAASLGVASAKLENEAEHDIERIVNSARLVAPSQSKQPSNWKNNILWVDDRPQNNTYERQAFETIGLEITTALSTQEAFDRLARNQYAVIISDMGRKEGPREGYVLLDKLREKGDGTPLFFYATSNAPEHLRETIEHGGQGCTNNPSELFEMVTRKVIEGPRG